MSHFCPYLVPLVHDKWWGQILDKVRNESFFHFLPGHPAAGQKVDNIGTLVPNLSPSCPGTFSFNIYLHFNLIFGWTDAGQKLDNCPRFVLISKRGVGGPPWPTCYQTGHKLDKLTRFCPNFVFSIPTLKWNRSTLEIEVAGNHWILFHPNREWFQESIQTIWLKHSLF